jgi:hypothetical protein
MAATLAPEAVSAQTALGDAFLANGSHAEALAHYQQALHAVQTIEPPLQADLIPGLKKKIAAL